MAKAEDRIAYVGKRAYELAGTGEHDSFAAVQQALVEEGYAESVAWLERPGVIAALSEICHLSRAQGDPANAP